MLAATEKLPARDIPTSSYDETPLPWQPSGQFPTGNSQIIDERDLQAPQRPARDVELGPSFWEKLMR